MKRRLGTSAAAACLVAAAALAATVSPAAAQTRPRLLVTNDDGIGATGLEQLVAFLAQRFDVVVAAPAEEASWAGQSKTIPAGMLRLREVAMKGAQAAYAIDGTPVDAVDFGLVELAAERPFDAVVAGVNRGSTLGFEATSTGVVGAAIEAAAHGVPAIAVAQDRSAHVFDVAANVTMMLLDGWLEKGLPAGVALSVNVPATAADRPQSITVARLGQPEMVVRGFHKVERDDPTQLWRIQYSKVRRPDRETDLDWYQRGEIIVTPLRWDGTAGDVLETLEGWQLAAPERVTEGPLAADPFQAGRGH